MRAGRRQCWTGSGFSSVRNSARLGLRSVAIGMALLLAAARLSPALQFNEAIYDEVKPSVLRVTCSAVDRSATGFLWSTPDTAVTALHVVAGCGNILIYYESLRVTRPATVIKVFRRADLALLKITNAPTARVLLVETTPASLDEQLSTLGYPLQTPSMTSTSLQLRYGGKTLRSIVPDSVAQALSGGSPSLDLEIASIEGHLLPGHSGAPIFDQRRKIVAIADGGLENGAAAVSWGIPAKFLSELAASNENTGVTQQAGANAASAHSLLFSAETETRNMGEFTCSGLTLTKLRTTSFSQVSKSVDDPLGLLQLVRFFAVDPSAFTFDVYQHLPSGATFVLPAGAELSQTADGNCTASLASGAVQMRLQLGVLASAMQAQAKSQSFELMLAGNNPQGWVADPQWTNLMPISRFDGMVVRRRAYTHIQMFPTRYQDKYLFEALALRNNVFIGSAAMYSFSPALAQRVAACRLAPGASNCDDVRMILKDWVHAVLAIQLTTFPVG